MLDKHRSDQVRYNVNKDLQTTAKRQLPMLFECSLMSVFYKNSVCYISNKQQKVI